MTRPNDSLPAGAPGLQLDSDLCKASEEIKFAIALGSRVHTLCRQYLLDDFSGFLQDFKWSAPGPESGLSSEEFSQFLNNVEIINNDDEISLAVIERLFRQISFGKSRLAISDLLSHAALPTNLMEAILVKLQKKISMTNKNGSFARMFQPYLTRQGGEEIITVKKFQEILRDFRCLPKDLCQLTSSEVAGLANVLLKGYATITLGTLQDFVKCSVAEWVTHATPFGHRSIRCDPYCVNDVIRSEFPLEGYFPIGGGLWYRFSTYETTSSAFISDIAISSTAGEENQLILSGYQLVKGQAISSSKRGQKGGQMLWTRRNTKGKTVVGVFVNVGSPQSSGQQFTSNMPPSQGFELVGVFCGAEVWQRKLDTRCHQGQVDRLQDNILHNLTKEAKAKRRFAKLKARTEKRLKRRFMVLEETGKCERQVDIAAFLRQHQVNGELGLDRFQLLLRRLGCEPDGSKVQLLFDGIRRGREAPSIHEVLSFFTFDPRRMSRFIHRIAAMKIFDSLTGIADASPKAAFRKVFDEGFKGVFYENNLHVELNQLMRLLQSESDPDMVRVCDLKRLIQAYHTHAEIIEQQERLNVRPSDRHTFLRRLISFVKEQYGGDPDKAFSALAGSESNHATASVLAKRLVAMPPFNHDKLEYLVACLERSTMYSNTGGIARLAFTRALRQKSEPNALFGPHEEAGSVISEGSQQDQRPEICARTVELSRHDWQSILAQIASKCDDLTVFGEAQSIDREEFKDHILSKICITRDKAQALMDALERKGKIQLRTLKALLPPSKPCDAVEVAETLRRKLFDLLKKSVNRGIKLSDIYLNMFNVGNNNHLTPEEFSTTMIRLFGSRLAKKDSVFRVFRSIATEGEKVIRFEDLYRFFYVCPPASSSYKEKLQHVIRSQKLHWETLQNCFEKKDTKGLGQVSAETARGFLNRLRPWVRPADIDALLFDYGTNLGQFDNRRLFSQFKLGDVEALLDTIRSYLQRQEIDCFAAFWNLDRASACSVSCTDFRAILHKKLHLQSFLSEKALQLLIDLFVDSDQPVPSDVVAPDINYLKFCRAVAPTRKHMQRLRDTLRRRLDALAHVRGGALDLLKDFGEYDKHETGFITCEEFRKVCASLSEGRALRSGEVLLLQHYYCNAFGKIAYREVCEFLMPEIADAARLVDMVNLLRQLLVCKDGIQEMGDWMPTARAGIVLEALGLRLAEKDVQTLLRLFAPRNDGFFSFRGFIENVLRSCAPGGFVYTLQHDVRQKGVSLSASIDDKLHYKRVADSLRAHRFEECG